MTLFESVYACRLLEQKTKKGRIVYHAGNENIEEFKPSVRWYEGEVPDKWQVPATFFTFNRDFALSIMGELVSEHKLEGPTLYRCIIKKDLNLFNANSLSEMKYLFKIFHNNFDSYYTYSGDELLDTKFQDIEFRIPNINVKKYKDLCNFYLRKDNWSAIERGVIPFLVYNIQKRGKPFYDGFVATEECVSGYTINFDNEIEQTFEPSSGQNIALFRPNECVKIIESRAISPSNFLVVMMMTMKTKNN